MLIHTVKEIPAKYNGLLHFGGGRPRRQPYAVFLDGSIMTYWESKTDAGIDLKVQNRKFKNGTLRGQGGRFQGRSL